MPIMVKTATGWEQLGATRYPGVNPAAVSPGWDGWGPAALSFAIARDPSTPHPDLAGGTPVEYFPIKGGDEPAWGGYIHDTPAGPDGLTVNCRGHSFLLDDDPYNRVYVHEALGDWKAAYTYDVPLGESRPQYMVNAGDGVITLGAGQGTVWSGVSSAGTVLDLGPDPANWCKRIAFNVQRGGSGAAGFDLYCRGSNGFSGLSGHANSGGGGTWNDLNNAPVFGGGSANTITAAAGGQQVVGSFDSPRRYVHIFLYRATTLTLAGDELYRLLGIRVFTQAAYESGGASILKASDILKYALTRAAGVDQDTSEILATVTNIPAFGRIGEERTARVEAELANSYHRWVLRFNARGRLQFRNRWARATLEANTRRPGIDWTDATVSSIEDVYNKVVVKGRSGSGVELRVQRLSADVGIRNVLDRRGRVRSKTIDVPVPTSTGAMQAIADAWLLRYARTPMKGTLVSQGRALRDLPTSKGIPAAYAGTRVGELAMLSNLDDLDTGERGRVAITVGAAYDEGEDKATLAVDNTRDDIDAVFARMGILQNA